MEGMRGGRWRRGYGEGGGVPGWRREGVRCAEGGVWQERCFDGVKMFEESDVEGIEYLVG